MPTDTAAHDRPSHATEVKAGVSAAATVISAIFPAAAPEALAIAAAASAIVDEVDDARPFAHLRAALAEWGDGEHDLDDDIEAGLDFMVSVINSVPGVPDSAIATANKYPEAVAAQVVALLRNMKAAQVSAKARRTARALRHLRATRRVIPANVADYAPVNRALLPGAVADRVEALRAAQVGDSGGPMTVAGPEGARLVEVVVEDGETSGPRPVVDPVLEIDDDTGEVPVAAPAPVVS